MTGWIEGSELLDLLARLGLFLLMFLAGFEIDFRALERQGRERLLMLVGVFALTLVAAHWFTVRLGYNAFMTLVLATTSVGLVVPTLRNTRRTATRLGQYVLISAIMADFLTLVLVAILALVERHGVSLQLLQMPALFFAVIMVLRSPRLAVWWFPERFRRLFSTDDPEELGMRASLALMLAFVGLSIALDIEPILGAFLAGTVFALVFRSRGVLEHQLNGFSYGFLIPIFFINVGLRFEIAFLQDLDVLAKAFAVIGGASARNAVGAIVAVTAASRMAMARSWFVRKPSSTPTVATAMIRLSLADRSMPAASTSRSENPRSAKTKLGTIPDRFGRALNFVAGDDQWRQEAKDFLACCSARTPRSAKRST